MDPIGAGNEARTRDLNLGKVALYQLSYSRTADAYCSAVAGTVKARVCMLANTFRQYYVQSLSRCRIANLHNEFCRIWRCPRS